uniref:Uncharacterized protein n=1 Tax=Glossina austeni TaxID=7395 RepID=A0A1A9UEA3_GLOAU
MLFKRKPRHKDLAKNVIPNNSKGKQQMNKLNARGPPIKDAKLWRKVFSVQKHIIKKKLNFNMVFKLQIRGRALVKIPLTFAEKQIIEAAELETSATGEDCFDQCRKRNYIFHINAVKKGTSVPKLYYFNTRV